MNSTLHGGKRVGAGRKRKSNIEKLENGNPGGRKLTTIDVGEDLSACRRRVTGPIRPETRLSFSKLRSNDS